MAQPEWSSLIDELGAAATNAREQLAELRSELKEARRVIRELRHERDEALKGAVGDRIDTVVKVGLDDYASTVKQAMADSVAKIEREFDNLFTAYMKGNRTSTIDLRDLTPRNDD